MVGSCIAFDIATSSMYMHNNFVPAEEVGSGDGPKITIKEDCDDIPTGFNTAYGLAK